MNNNRVQEINDGKIILKGANGEEKEFDLLFTFDSDETGKSYMAYTDNSVDQAGNVQVFASIYDPSGADLNLYPLESDKEWKVIQEILNGVQEQVRQAQENMANQSEE